MSFHSHLPRRSLLPGVLMGCLAVALSSVAAESQVEGLSYSLQPTIEHYRWSSELGLEDASLYGGRLGLNFGRTMTIEAYYAAKQGIRTNLEPGFFPEDSDLPFQNQKVDLANYGADLVLHLSRGPLVPFLSTGGGIYRFDPQRGARFEEIGVNFGGGLRYALHPRFDLSLGVKSALFRLDRLALAPAESLKTMSTDPQSNDIRSSFAVRAGIDYRLGGYDAGAETEIDRALRARYEAGLSGTSWPIQPFVGTLKYARDLDLPDQDVIGVRSGTDLGRYVGMRLFYWRGVESGFDATDPVQGYGGELQFALNSGAGVRPYLVGGVGVIDYLQGFTDRLGATREDETALIAGGGLRFTLGDRFRVDASARDYVISERSLSDVTDTKQLLANWMYSVGLSFSLGGSGGKSKTVPLAPDSSGHPAAGAASGATTGTGSGTVGEPNDTAAITAAMTADTAAADSTAGAAAVGAPGEVTPGDATPGEGTAAESGATPRMITFPAPVEGEVYIRYGKPGAVSIESRLQSGAVRSYTAPADSASQVDSTNVFSVPATVPAARPETPMQGSVSTAQILDELRAIEDRLARRIDERLAQARMGEPQRADSPIVVETEEQPTTESIEERPESQKGIRSLRPYTALAFNDPKQLALGFRVDLGPVTKNSRLDVIPELSYSLAKNTSVLAAANLQLRPFLPKTKAAATPFLYAGIGILTFDENAGQFDRTSGVINLGYGVDANIGRWRLFAEHQGVDFFDYNRLILGVSLLERSRRNLPER
ncbi:MAG: hypothetical protein R3E12_10135 [Candidatus Eisenbacteria bacterium]|uniref:Outer membrane protein beta-barrel domain-containing protein n=1 Tax=Eiseniibacteriota bacterium TaxID=2212470 RepID=A0A956RP58_UNCEI|nr:hypothetical protein [Candidatus Eisenbacteria bacterium]